MVYNKLNAECSHFFGHSVQYTRASLPTHMSNADSAVSYTASAAVVIQRT